jgi:hypothetical protein
MLTQTVALGTRFHTGQINPQSGVYRWDGNVNGSSFPQPGSNQREIPLSRGEKFPPCNSVACYWKLIRYA